MSDDLRCHYCSKETVEANGPVVGWLIEVRRSEHWARPVCNVHTAMPPGYSFNPQVLRYLGDPALPHPYEPCGAHAVTEWDHGSPSVTRWCDRRSGPCPFLGATIDAEGRGCAVSMLDQYAEQLQVTRRVRESLARS